MQAQNFFSSLFKKMKMEENWNHELFKVSLLMITM